MAQAEAYGPFLGRELTFVYKGRLLISMPNGSASSGSGTTWARSGGSSRIVPIAPGIDGLVDSDREGEEAARSRGRHHDHRPEAAAPVELLPKVLIARRGTVLILGLALGGIVLWRRQRTAEQ